MQSKITRILLCSLFIYTGWTSFLNSVYVRDDKAKVQALPAPSILKSNRFETNSERSILTPRDSNISSPAPLIESLAGRPTSILTPTTSTGHYNLPYPEGTGQVVAGGWISSHQAIDFDMREGQPVVAARDGIVAKFRNDSRIFCGGADHSCLSESNMISLYHPDVDEYTDYMHLRPYSVPSYISERFKAGEIVEIKRGEKIGEAGHTGYSWPMPGVDHLHFQVRGRDPSGQYLDFRNPYFIEAGGPVQEGDKPYISANTPPAGQPYLQSVFTIQPGGDGWYDNYTNNNTPSFTWTINGKAEIDPVGYYIAIDDPIPDGGYGRDWTIGAVANWTVPPDAWLPNGPHFVTIASRDSEGRVYPSQPKAIGDAPYYEFVVDTKPPSNPLTVYPNCEAFNNIWQSLCNWPHFTWNGASDRGGVGVHQYDYQWLTEAGTMIEIGVTGEASFTPQNPVGDGVYILRLRTRDKLGNLSKWADLFVLRYNSAAPGVNLQTSVEP